MTKCVFCGRDEAYFKGLNLIGNDGVVYYYCSSKCRKNSLKLKRDKRKLKWTESYHVKREDVKQKEADALVGKKKDYTKKTNQISK